METWAKMLIDVPEERLAQASFILLKDCEFFPSFAKINKVLEDLEYEDAKSAKERKWLEFSGGLSAIELHCKNRDARIKREGEEIEARRQKELEDGKAEEADD